MVNALLQKDRKDRIGYSSGKDGFKEIQKHPWFDDIDWAKLEAQELTPPYMPNFGKMELSDLFNVQTDSKAMKDTYIPRAQKAQVES